MPKKIIVDFESYYDKEISVTTQGLRNYVAGTDAYIVSIVSDDVEFCGTLEQAREAGLHMLALDPENEFYAANSNFDQAWWEKYFPKTVRPWKCILDHAAFHQFPRDLAGICKTVLKEKLDKSVRDEMKGVRFESLSDEGQQRVVDYCLTDSIREKQVLDRLPPMSPIEDELAAHTRLINRRGIRVNTAKIERDCQQLELLRHQAMHALPWVEDGGKPLSYQLFAEYCRFVGIEPPTSLDKRDAECAKWMIDHPKHSHTLRNMRLFRGVNTKLEKLKLIRDSADENNVIPLDLLYCGARHTRRWSSVNVNVQNLDKARAFEEEMAQLSFFKENPAERPGIFMREYFLPPPGMKFGIIDFSQIEPRCANWIAGNVDLLEAIRNGYSYYEAYARLYKKWSGAPGTLKKDYPKEKYTKLKNEAIGLGYGMGAAKYTTYAGVPNEEAEAVVRGFRRSNTKIVGQWRRLDRLIQTAAMEREDNSLSIEMPTGDLLTHFNVRTRLGGGYESYTIKGDFTQMSHQPRLWGGTLFENVTQRMARDILGEAVLRIENAGFPVFFHAHDEIVIGLDAGTAELDFEQARMLMSIPPDWCPDLPLGADGAVCSTYTKLD